MVRREAENCARILECCFRVDTHRPVSAPQPEPIVLGIEYAYRPRMHIYAAAVKKARRTIVVLKFLDVGDVMRLVSGAVSVGLFHRLLI
jgi:hypothetical protein